MALSNGIFGAIAPPASTYRTLFKVDAGLDSVTAEVVIQNHDGANAATARAYVCPPGYVEGAAPPDAHLIIPKDSPVYFGSPLGRTGLAVGEGWSVVVWVSSNTCNAFATGYIN